MDYVTLIDSLKTTYSFEDTDAVIGFGGSYGGMLASWARMKYPHVWDGAIAGSAPIVSFEDMTPDVDPNFYAEGVTYDVTPAAGASEFCEANLRKAFAEEALVGLDAQKVRSALQLCDDDDTSDEDIGWRATFWLNEALSYMAMGNFPYPSTYILNGDGTLPAFPVRVACEFLAEVRNVFILPLLSDERMAIYSNSLLRSSFAGSDWRRQSRRVAGRPEQLCWGLL